MMQTEERRPRDYWGEGICSCFIIAATRVWGRYKYLCGCYKLIVINTSSIYSSAFLNQFGCLQLFSPFWPFFGPYLCWDCNNKATATTETVCVDVQGEYIMHSIHAVSHFWTSLDVSSCFRLFRPFSPLSWLDCNHKARAISETSYRRAR